VVFRIVVDTNVFVGALLRHEGQNRQIVRACLEDRARPIIGQALFCEYEDVLGRKELFRDSLLSSPDRQRLFEAFLSVCEWVHVYYGWRPNLRDEQTTPVRTCDCRRASAMVTNNVRDFGDSDLRFPKVRA